MNIQINTPLAQHLSMKLGGPARFMAEVSSVEQLQQLITNTKEKQLPFYVIGGGTNIIAHDEGFNGVIIKNRIMGMEVIAEDKDSVTIKASAGELWDDLVTLAVEKNLSGIAAMSIIPGTCGAAPVQNIGAYGEEVADTLVEVEALDTTTNQLVVLSNEQCQFGYRTSLFRDGEPGRYIITAITLTLYKTAPAPPFYAGLQRYFDEHHITDYTVQIIREAVMAIRHSKLPNPTHKPNSGSFFKNAVVPHWMLNDLLNQHPDMPHFDMGEGNYKIPTGWLIDACELKGKLFHGMRINPANALVLINESAESYQDLAAARDYIATAVYNKFKIRIEQEPVEI